MGGHNGNEWLDAMHLYTPSTGAITNAGQLRACGVDFISWGWSAVHGIRILPLGTHSCICLQVVASFPVPAATNHSP